jgi:hypothetical protein
MAEFLKEYSGTWEEILTHSDELAGKHVSVQVHEPEPKELTQSEKILAD